MLNVFNYIQKSHIRLKYSSRCPPVIPPALLPTFRISYNSWKNAFYYCLNGIKVLHFIIISFPLHLTWGCVTKLLKSLTGRLNIPTVYEIISILLVNTLRSLQENADRRHLQGCAGIQVNRGKPCDPPICLFMFTFFV